jgi:hypothetical protein
MSADQRFPGRPDHPDFWLIAQALLDQDAQADVGRPVDEMLSLMIDSASASYAAFQRGMRAAREWRHLPRSLAREAVPVLGGVWLDGFLAGMTVQQKIAERNSQTGTDGDITPEDVIG